MTSASMATLDADGRPHVSLVTIARADNGEANLLLSSLARHTRNLRKDSCCCLLITRENTDLDDILAQTGVSVAGSAELIEKDDLSELRDRFLNVHPAASQYVDFADFGFYRFHPIEFHLVGGFGRIGTFSAESVFHA